MTPAQREAILAEVKGGNKIAAIKLCREATGLGLAEAKDFVERLESSPDAQLAPAPEAGALAPVADLLFAGRKIDAIKLYREQVKPGAGLKESKEAVEQLEAGLRAQHPEKFSAAAQKSGCTAVLAVLAVLIVVLLWVRG
jgi:ribosomal protein L7/L12